ncbi:hypothetical protein [Heyndrickxia sporothermodurans]
MGAGICWVGVLVMIFAPRQ